MKLRTKAAKKARRRKHVRRHARCAAAALERVLERPLLVRHIHDEMLVDPLIVKAAKMMAYAKTARQMHEEYLGTLGPHMLVRIP